MDKKPDLSIEDLIPDLQKKLNEALAASGLFPAAAFPLAPGEWPEPSVENEDEP